MRVLVFTPEHPVYGMKDATHISVHMSINRYSGPVDWLISKGDNPHKTPFDNVLYQHNKAREIVLTSGYDALMSIEADMVVPVDVVEKLIATEADIAYGLYVWRSRPNRWNAYKELTLWGGTSVSYDHTGEDVRRYFGTVMNVCGLGLGCTLIRRQVLEQITFRLHDGTHSWIQDEYADQFRELGINPYRERRSMVCDDWLLAMDAQHYGFTQRCDLSVVCGHIDGDQILWPDVSANDFIRREERFIYKE